MGLEFLVNNHHQWECIMKIKSFAGIALMTAASSTSFAVTVDMKPGLWEQTYKLNDASLAGMQKVQAEEIQRAAEEMKKQLAAIPAEQRKQMEAMLQAQGVDVAAMQQGMAEQSLQRLKNGSVTKSCVTAAEIDKGVLPSHKKDCVNTLKEVARNQYKIISECKGDAPSHGTIDVTFQNPKSYTGNMTFSERNITMQGTLSGKWLAADCGDVKPGSDVESEDDTSEE